MQTDALVAAVHASAGGVAKGESCANVAAPPPAAAGQSRTGNQ